MENLTDKEFQRMFRLNREAFYFLLHKIEPIIKGQGSLRGASFHSPHEIPVVTKLAVALRWLAGGSYLDICFAFGISSASFFKANGILWRTIGAIDTVLEIGFPLNDPVKLEEISEGFSLYCQGRMKGCVMAMDGWVCQTRCPSKTESPNQICYRNRKQMWGILVFAGCDHKCRFTMLSTRCPGATNDSLAWTMSELKMQVIDTNMLPPQYYFVVDEAISSTEYVLCPYGGRGIGTWRDSFNYHLSCMRQCIERAFGILTRRWGIFWRPLSCDLARWSLIVQVCGKLHNLCIDFNLDNINIAVAEEDHEEGDSAEVFLNRYTAEHAGEWPTNADNSSQRRLNITKYFKEQGWSRPPHAHANNRVHN
jgi:hypothetical protein